MHETTYDQAKLVELIREFSLKIGKFTLASGKEASYYLDCRKVTLHAEGANQIGAGILDLLGDSIPDAIGGMAIGADAITAATVTLAGQRGLPLRGFIVRKESKAHGTGQDVEGPVEAGMSAVIVEDVVTTGGSAIQAIKKVESFGMQVREVIAIVDRLEGGKEAFAAAGYSLRTLLTIRDFGIE